MALDALLIALGLFLAGLTLLDVFQTVLAPGGSRSWLKVARRVVFVLLPPWRAASKGRGISGMFAPAVLVACFAIWVCLLMLGFGMIAYALRAQFRPPIEGFAEALYFAGSSMVTIGLSETDAVGVARWAVFAAGLCGLGVITLAITYLLLVLNSVAQRDTGILKLNTSAGVPPSAVTLLETFARLRLVDDFPDLMREARDWCVGVRQSHATHPSLIYFESIGAGAGWPASLGALLDLALFAERWFDDERTYGPAVLLRRDALEMARELALLVGLKPVEERRATDDLRGAAERLAAAGYSLKPDIDYARSAEARADLQACVSAMARHLGKPTAVLLPSGQPSRSSDGD